MKRLLIDLFIVILIPIFAFSQYSSDVKVAGEFDENAELTNSGNGMETFTNNNNAIFSTST